jgi:pilus assembly protein CpaE
MQGLTFITLGKDSESSKELAKALSSTGYGRVVAEYDNPSEFLANIARLRPSAAVITLRQDHLDNGFALIKEAIAAAPATAIITACSEASPAMIMGSIRAGAREFLQLPVNPDELRTVMERTAEFCRLMRNSTSSNSQLIAIFSGKGGAGVSFFATNLAAAMSTQTLLFDLNLQAGDSSSFLGLEPKYSLVDFVRNRARLDESLISSLVTPHSTNLSLLAAPTEAHEAEEVKAEDVTEILHQVGQRYERIVVDLPHTFDPITIATLDMADDILLVLTLDIPGIRATKRALKVFDNLGYPREKTRIVVNRWSKNIDVELQKVEGHLGERLIGFIPNDYRKVMDSINLGRPLVQSDPASKIALEIKRIAGLTVENSSTPSLLPRKKSLRSLFGNKNSTTSLELSTVIDNA